MDERMQHGLSNCGGEGTFSPTRVPNRKSPSVSDEREACRWQDALLWSYTVLRSTHCLERERGILVSAAYEVDHDH